VSNSDWLGGLPSKTDSETCREEKEDGLTQVLGIDEAAPFSLLFCSVLLFIQIQSVLQSSILLSKQSPQTFKLDQSTQRNSISNQPEVASESKVMKREREGDVNGQKERLWE
jgi:hypothetical protein